MKAAKIVFLVFLLFVISCDKDNGNPYPDPDEMNVSDGDEFVDAKKCFFCLYADQCPIKNG